MQDTHMTEHDIMVTMSFLLLSQNNSNIPRFFSVLLPDRHTLKEHHALKICFCSFYVQTSRSPALCAVFLFPTSSQSPHSLNSSLRSFTDPISHSLPSTAASLSMHTPARSQPTWALRHSRSMPPFCSRTWQRGRS